MLAEYVEAKRISSALYGEVCEATDSLFEAVRVAGLGNPKYEALRQRWLDEFTHQASVTGYGKAHEAVNRISRQLRKRVAQLVGTRATTIRGAMAKLEIMSAIDHECEEPGIYEEHDEWLSIVRADLERIAGGAS